MSETQKAGNQQDKKRAASKGRREETQRRLRTFATVSEAGSANFGRTSSSLLSSQEEQGSFLSREPSGILSRQPSDIMRPPANDYSPAMKQV